MLPRQNVWRIYADVFSNLMGLVLLGGLGLMALFGGAVVSKFPNSTIHQPICPMKPKVIDILRADSMSGSPSNHCEIRVQNTPIHFANGSDELPTNAVMDRFCRTIVGVLAITRDTNGRVFIVGRASQLNDGGNCATTRLFTAHDVDLYLSLAAPTDEKYRHMLDIAKKGAISEKDNVTMRETFCNYNIAARRAIKVTSDCLTRLYDNEFIDMISNQRPKDIVKRMYTLTRSSIDDNTQSNKECNNGDGKDSQSCMRTVTLEIDPGISIQ